MEIELIEKKDQPLLSRIEVRFKIKHPNESTPKRDEIRGVLAEQLTVKKGTIIIDSMKSDFGRSETIGFAKLYQSEDKAKAIERKHILVRNKLITKESKKKTAKKE